MVNVANDYRADIDGVRAVAVALVGGFHTVPLSIPGGYIGVDVFFVISGYLITRLIIELQTAGRFSIALFYIRRARRILPALNTVIAATLIMGWFVLSPVSYKNSAYKRLPAHFLFQISFIGERQAISTKTLSPNPCSIFGLLESKNSSIWFGRYCSCCCNGGKYKRLQRYAHSA